MQRSLKALALAAVSTGILGLGSCKSPEVVVEVRTDPNGAKLYVNGLPQGVSNRRVTFDFSESPRNLLQVVLPDRPVVEAHYTRSQLPKGEEFIMIKIPR